MSIEQINQIARLQRVECQLYILTTKVSKSQRAWIVEQIASTKQQISQLQNQ